YARESGKATSTCRRELGVLRAALSYCEREGYLKHAPPVVLPENAAPKDRWLTRREMALILRASRQLRVDGRHLSKFILACRYTGTRKSAALALTIDLPSPTAGHIDTETGIIHRIGSDERKTKKRRGRAKAPRQFLGHVRRWKANGCRYVVETNRGERVADIRKGWVNMIEIAEKLAKKDGWHFDGSDVTPHTLRHTAITWAMQNGARIADVSSFFSVSVETLERTYWHHHPDFQQSAVEAMERHGGK
ncbi:MAG: tyrosine-type recombinase/integrase, partial [Pseudomonadota bacterium]